MAYITVKLKGTVARFYNAVEDWRNRNQDLEANVERSPDRLIVYLHLPDRHLGALCTLLEQQSGPEGLYLATVLASKSHMSSPKFKGDGFKKRQRFLSMAESGKMALGALPSELAAKRNNPQSC